MTLAVRSILDTGLQLTFLVCVIYAVISDFKTLLIPNWISLTLVGAFAASAALHLPPDLLAKHLMVMGLVLAVSIAFFTAGWMGGGDVKFMSAIALWMGPAHVGPFVLLMALLGAALALSLMFVDRLVAVTPRAQQAPLVNRWMELAKSRQCPYGVAIGLAGLSVSMDLFAGLRVM